MPLYRKRTKIRMTEFDSVPREIIYLAVSKLMGIQNVKECCFSTGTYTCNIYEERQSRTKSTHRI